MTRFFRLKEPLKRGFAIWAKEYCLIRDVWRGTFPVPRNGIRLFLLERLVMSILIFFRSFSLIHFGGFFRSDSKRIDFSEMYVLSWFIVLAFLLFIPVFSSFWLFAIVGYRLIDGLNYRLCILFVDRYKSGWGLRSINRSLLLLLLNYGELIIGFAIMFLASGSIGMGTPVRIITSPGEALYFSVVTITTVGYGDIIPISPTGRTLALLEPLSGFVLVALVLAVFITGITDIKELRNAAKPSSEDKI